jgi:hypothetical protein
MTTITEIAPDVYRICTYVPAIDLRGDGARALLDLASAMHEVLGAPGR